MSASYKFVKINRETKYVIYGGGEVGNNCFIALSSAGNDIVYALDKNKSGDDIVTGTHTYQLGTEPVEKKDQYVVIICLANGLIHMSVAELLYKEGYRYIVFLPLGGCIKDRDKRRLTSEYNKIITSSISEDENISVLDFGRYLNPNLDTDNAVLRDYGNELIVWCGLESLYSESLALWKGDKTKVHTNEIFKDRNICISPPVKTLFDYFSGKVDSPEYYFASRNDRSDEESRSMDLIARKKLYSVFEDENNKGMEFFIEGAPSAIWNPSNYWNLVGGHHRTLYLLHKGHTLFPIRISRDDYEKWINVKEYQSLVDYIANNKIRDTYAPIPHPGFINWTSKYERSGETMMAAVLSEVYSYYLNDISAITVLDTFDDEGYFARIFERQGAKKSVFYNTDSEQRELAEFIDRMLHRNRVVIRGDEGVEERYDIVFCKPEEMEKYQSICKGIMIVETDKVLEQYSKKEPVFRKYENDGRNHLCYCIGKEEL